ncbi:MAG: TraM recognition domain-containing protein [Candidatus Tyrphobacter sp.]
MVTIAYSDDILLNQRNYVGGLAKGTPIVIDEVLASQGTVVIGPTGTGKGYGVLQPFVSMWLHCQNAGLFAFSEKPNWARILVSIALFQGRRADQIHVVGPRTQSAPYRVPMPLVPGLSPDAIANFLKTAAELDGKQDTFFLNSAINLVRRVASTLKGTSQLDPITIEVMADNGEVLERYALNYDMYSIAKLSCMDPEILESEVVPQIRASRHILDSIGKHEAVQLIDTHLPDLIKAARIKAEKQREGVVGTVDAILAPFFSSQAFTDAFSGSQPFDLSLLGEGHVVILDIPKAEYPASFRLAFLLAFEQMKLLMNKRMTQKDEGEHLNPVLFVADEYANVAAKEHAQMWRISRESMICPLIAYQIHTDLQAVLGVQEADGMIRNFATKIVLPTDDPATLALINGGKSDIQKQSVGSGHAGNNWMPNVTTSDQQYEVVDQGLMDSLINNINENTAESERKAQVVIRTVQNGKRVLEVCWITAWAPPRLTIPA